MEKAKARVVSVECRTNKTKSNYSEKTDANNGIKQSEYGAFKTE